MTTQAEKFAAAQAAVKAFRTKHGNLVVLPGDTTRVLKLKQRYYALEDAVSDAYWTDEMESAIKGSQR